MGSKYNKLAKGFFKTLAQVNAAKAAQENAANMIDLNDISRAITGTLGQYGATYDEEGNITGIEGAGFSDLSSLSELAGEQIAYGRDRNVTLDPVYQGMIDTLKGNLQQGVEAQRTQFDIGEQKRRGIASEFMTRRGLGGSSAALNAANKLEADLTADRGVFEANAAREMAGIDLQAFEKQYGMTQDELDRRFQSLNFGTGLSSSITQSQNLAKQLNLESIASGIETMSLPQQLMNAAYSAYLSGKKGDSGNGGDSLKNTALTYLLTGSPQIAGLQAVSGDMGGK